MTILLNNVDIAGTSAEFTSTGGSAIINVRADDFDGGTVEIQVASSQDSLNRFVALENGIFTADASVKIDYLPLGLRLIAELISPGASTDNVFCDILQ